MYCSDASLEEDVMGLNRKVSFLFFSHSCDKSYVFTFSHVQLVIANNNYLSQPHIFYPSQQNDQTLLRSLIFVTRQNNARMGYNSVWLDISRWWMRLRFAYIYFKLAVCVSFASADEMGKKQQWPDCDAKFDLSAFDAHGQHNCQLLGMHQGGSCDGKMLPFLLFKFCFYIRSVNLQRCLLLI